MGSWEETDRGGLNRCYLHISLTLNFVAVHEHTNSLVRVLLIHLRIKQDTSIWSRSNVNVANPLLKLCKNEYQNINSIT